MSRKLLLMELACPHCGAVLTKGSKVELDAHEPESHQDGRVALSALFGDHSVATELRIAPGALLQFRCPGCEASVMLASPCRICGAPLASLNLTSGGCVEFCSRWGCKGYVLGGIGDVDDLIKLMNRICETPFD